MIVTIGVKDLILVDMGDVLMVCHKDQAQKVRQVVEQLKKVINHEYKRSLLLVDKLIGGNTVGSILCKV